MNNNLLIILSGPSGVGKGTIIKKLKGELNFATSVSCTTRAPRDEDKEGVTYFFKTEEQFKKMIENGEFLEYSAHHNALYGTPKAFVEQKLREGDVMLEIEVDGAVNAKKKYPSALLIFIDPPSVEELVKRLLGRGSETEEERANRLNRLKYEFSKKGEYDYVVVNDDLEKAVQEIKNIILARKKL